jgi:hypothetical protein
MKQLVRRYFNCNPLVIFFPFLLIFILIIFNLSSTSIQGDEGRYYEFAKNIINGFYSPPAPNINLWSGPGYPLFLVPFVWLDLPLLTIKLANAFLQYFSIILLFLSIKKYSSRKCAIIFSFFWATYYIAYQELPLMLTEPLTSFLCALIVFFISRLDNSEYAISKYSIYAGLTLGFLGLTKIIFGYVIFLILLFYIILFLIQRAKCNLRSNLIILTVAFLVNIPYLIYTYNLTDKLLYWGNSGGSSLYWMSTPVEGEFGEWNNGTFTANCGHDLTIPCNASLIAKNHQKDMDFVAQFPVINQDDELKKIAINNIKNHPAKYLRNCLSNVSRIFFGIPNSYFYQREQTIFRLLPNSLLLSLIILISIFTLSNYRNIKSEIRLIVSLFFVYLFLSTLVSAYPRQLYVVIPFIFFWASYVLNKAINLKMKFIAE